MEPGNDLRTADRDTLIALIVQQRDMIIRQQAIIESLEKRVAPLEARAKSKGAGRMPGLKPKLNRSQGEIYICGLRRSGQARDNPVVAKPTNLESPYQDLSTESSQSGILRLTNWFLPL